MANTPPTSSQALRYKGYVPGLDVLRGLAILVVVIYHCTDGRVPWTTTTGVWRPLLLLASFGSSGVQLFFVLSGFLITGILLDTRNSPAFYTKFYTRRVLRLLPAYILLLAVLRVLGIVSWRFVLAAMLYIANMARLVGAQGAEYGALWSLAVEEQFYLIWPALSRRMSLERLTHFIGGYLLLDLMFRFVSIAVFHSVELEYKLWGHAEMLLWGALVAVLLRRGVLHGGNISRWIATLAALAVPSFALDWWVQSNPYQHIVFFALFHFAFLFGYGALLLVVLKYNSDPLPGVLRSLPARALVFLGYISYGLYLVHPLVVHYADLWEKGTSLEPSAAHPARVVLHFFMVFAASCALATVSRRYFEEFFLRRKDKVVPYREPLVNERPEGAALPTPLLVTEEEKTTA